MVIYIHLFILMGLKGKTITKYIIERLHMHNSITQNIPEIYGILLTLECAEDMQFEEGCLKCLEGAMIVNDAPSQRKTLWLSGRASEQALGCLGSIPSGAIIFAG